MEVVDLIIDPQHKMWTETVREISESGDSLKDNYLNINFTDFLSFTAVVNNSKIICFSGLQYDCSKWGSKIARISSRMWIHPSYRFRGMTKFTGGEKFLNSYYCIPRQIEVAKANQLSSLFVSREHNRQAFSEYLELLKINTQCEFKLLDKRYWVCGPSVRSNGCLQHIGLYHLSLDGKQYWHNVMDANQEF
jgi:hypothetical protein